MATLSLRDAAQQTGVSKSTIFRAIKSGRLSAARTDEGGFAIDPAELFRVYPPVAADRAAQREMGHNATGSATAETVSRLAALEAELAGVRALLGEVRQSRDDWRDQVTRLTATLPKPEESGLADERARAEKVISGFRGLAEEYEARIAELAQLRSRPWWRRLVSSTGDANAERERAGYLMRLFGHKLFATLPGQAGRAPART
jgi:excisionase family DNA binding protein